MPSLTLDPVPPALKPLVRAYLLGYGSAVAPRLLNLILKHVYLQRRIARKLVPPEQRAGQHRTLGAAAAHVLKTGLEPRRFPTFCAVLVGGSSLLQGPMLKVVSRLFTSLSIQARLRLSRWLSTFLAAWLGLRLLQSKQHPPRRRSSVTEGSMPPSPPLQSTRLLGGKTIDLTLFAATRAIDVLVGELWSQRRARRQATGKWTQAEAFLTYMTDPLVFVTSCAFIMWNWFYTPECLPPGYDKWITSAAQVDQRLIQALRRLRFRHIIYGKETGQKALVTAMCKDYKLPYEWGDPVKAVPYPCDLVHMGCGPSCEYHAASRFARSWRWSMFTYLPLALGMQLRNPSRKGILRAFVSAARSSAFLATYITLFYYGVCLGRTRIGPHVVGKDAPSRQRIDGGYCVGTGCFLCGWSILVETVSRRKDMSLFVAPKALGTIVPRQYPQEKQWRETLVFAASSAVVLTCVLENPKRVRGVLGKVLHFVAKR